MAAVESRHHAARMRVAVIGAGVSGLACARMLHDQGVEVTIVDRGRAPGGRASSRRVSMEEQEVSIDHGAPFFSVSDSRFERFVRSWVEDGVCAPWQSRRAVLDGGVLGPVRRTHGLYVGTPSMSAVCRHLGEGLDVHRSTAATTLEPSGEGWRLGLADEGAIPGRFDAVAIAAPSPQAARLLGGHSAHLEELVGRVAFEPIWSGAFVTRAGSADVPEVIEVAGDDVIDRMIRDDAKPGRGGGPRWIVQARPSWSARRYDASPGDVQPALLERASTLLASVLGHAPDLEPVFPAHRWGLARPVEPVCERCLFDGEAGLGVCGDGLGGSGVEAAFLSGHALGARVLTLRGRRSSP